MQTSARIAFASAVVLALVGLSTTGARAGQVLQGSGARIRDTTRGFELARPGRGWVVLPEA
ncbi:MAG: hypothetical protein ACC662_07680, partial [Planctomycetota bacterium]